MRPRHPFHLWTLAIACALLGTACGGSNSMPAAPGGPSSSAPPAAGAPAPPPLTASVTVTADGVSPKDVVIGVGGRVTFINKDVRPHDVYSNPHDHNVHRDCPEINAVGFLTTGQSRQTEIFEAARECGYHDHILPNFEPLNGRIIIQ